MTPFVELTRPLESHFVWTNIAFGACCQILRVSGRVWFSLFFAFLAFPPSSILLFFVFLIFPFHFFSFWSLLFCSSQVPGFSCLFVVVLKLRKSEVSLPKLFTLVDKTSKNPPKNIWKQIYMLEVLKISAFFQSSKRNKPTVVFVSFPRIHLAFQSLSRCLWQQNEAEWRGQNWRDNGSLIPARWLGIGVNKDLGVRPYFAAGKRALVVVGMPGASILMKIQVECFDSTESNFCAHPHLLQLVDWPAHQILKGYSTSDSFIDPTDVLLQFLTLKQHQVQGGHDGRVYTAKPGAGPKDWDRPRVLPGRNDMSPYLWCQVWRTGSSHFFGIVDLVRFDFALF